MYVAGSLHTEQIWKEMVSFMINCYKTDPIISRPVLGSSCKRHKVLVLNPVSAANLLIGSKVKCEHSGQNCLPCICTVWNTILTLIHFYQCRGMAMLLQRKKSKIELKLLYICVV